ncbi:MAG: hypothetical protein UZ21_OP11001001155 [Microgenomates bacterium OLB22]|nr:MAG: hypothetical protein UZ21_OP11001001155 [Microgenomates bacterium OLB22]
MKTNNNTHGFSLIELLVVVTAIGITLPALFGMFFINLQSQKKTLIVQTTKRDGDTALSLIEQTIRQRAVTVVSDDGSSELCGISNSTEDLGSDVTFRDSAGDRFSYSLDSIDIDSIKIASDSSTGVDQDLTSPLTSVTSLNFSCSRTSDFSNPVITISFDIKQSGTPARQEEQNAFTYTTSVQLRNYQEL